MFRVNIQKILIRSLSDSSFKHDRQVKYANSRLSKYTRRQVDRESKPRDRLENPVKLFEPFPVAVTEENKFELMKKLVTPLYAIPYQEQLDGKEAHCKNSLRYISQTLYKAGTPVRLDVRRLPCPVNPIVPARETENYRNKEDMSIWHGLDRKTPTIGYLIFSIAKHGDSVCVEPNQSPVTRSAVKNAVDILQQFVRFQAKLSICYSLGQDGGWRRFFVRTNRNDDLMICGILNPTTLKVSQVLEERDNFRDFVVQRCKDSNLNLKSLYYQPCPSSHCLHKNVPYELLFGEPTIEETFNDLRIKISPETFVHQSTSGGEILYKTVMKTMEETFNLSESSPRKPLIIDSKCGSGALSLQLAKYASKVIGVDVSSQAVRDATENAKLNGIENVEFINANLEIIIERIIEKHAGRDRDVMMICDAPKAGLHKNITEVIRHTRAVSKIIYVSPKADSKGTVENLTDLCEKCQGKSIPPFSPVSATPVDVYPHVDACHLVLALERLPE